MKNTNKILISLIVFLFILTGCGNTSDTPTKKVEDFLGKYQSMDSEVLSQLDNIIDKDSTMTDDQKKEYKSLMEKQYQNLSYKIKNETIDGDAATVEVEIEVYDYASTNTKSKEYYDKNQSEFKDDSGKLDDSKYIDYKIKQMKNTTDKRKYEITFVLYKDDGKWKMDDISDSDREKIHGLYVE